MNLDDGECGRIAWLTCKEQAIIISTCELHDRMRTQEN